MFCSGAFPSLQRRGGRDVKKMQRSLLEAADGVVAYKPGYGVSNHPVCAIAVASRFFLAGADTPPLQGEICLA